MEKQKEYTNGEVTIVWKPDLCIHSAKCVGGLPAVFDNKARPWINAGGAGSEAIIAQVKQCPSGALSYYLNAAQEEEKETVEAIRCEPLPNGPLVVHGMISVEMPDGTQLEKGPRTSFCRCGASEKKPFCDGTHRKIGFSG